MLRRALRTEPSVPHAGRDAPWGLLSLGAAVAGLLVGWFLIQDRGPVLGPVVPLQETSVPTRAPTAVEVEDPAEQRRLADLEDRRGRYASLRAAFDAGSRPSGDGSARLSRALGALWPAGRPTWSVACIGQLCRVDAGSPASIWQAQLASDPGVARMSERVVIDPDGAASPAYLVLLAENASAGAALLDEVEEEFRVSREIRECLSRAGVTGQVEYALQVDSSGYSYRQSTDLRGEPLDCADRVLGEILDRHPPRGAVTTSTRTLALRR